MIDILLIFFIFNLSFWFYLFDIINGYNLIIIPILITKIILTFEKDFFYFCPKIILQLDDNLNKKCFLYIFNLFFKKKKNEKKIQSKIIIDTVSEEE
jgi:hypothetical protein